MSDQDEAKTVKEFNIFMVKATLKSWVYLIPALTFGLLGLWGKGFNTVGILFFVAALLVWFIPAYLTLSTAMLAIIEKNNSNT